MIRAGVFIYPAQLCAGVGPLQQCGFISADRYAAHSFLQLVGSLAWAGGQPLAPTPELLSTPCLRPESSLLL